MANTFLNTGRSIVATSNPTNNIEKLNDNANNVQTQTSQQGVQTQNTQTSSNNTINPITIPIQIQPQIASMPSNTNTQANNISNIQTNNVQKNTNNVSSVAPTPQEYNPSNTNNNVVDFNQIYNSYQNAFGNSNTQNSNNTNTTGVKKTSIGSTIVTPTNVNKNTVQGQYQSAYADTINGLISEMLAQMNNGFQYNPQDDQALHVATEYAANSTLQSLAGSGVLNSSSTAERVARIVSELIPQYEEKAHDRWIEYLGQLADTAQIVMSYDSQQFEYWKDAKDREFQEKEFAYQKQQDELENAWKRVDELGYVDNEASTILGVPVGTLSGEARLAKEQQEFELQKMREQLQIQYENDKALYELKAELDKEYASYEQQLNKEYADYEYQLQNKYASSSSSSEVDTTSLSTYEDIINTRWAEKNLETDAYTLPSTNQGTVYNFIKSEYANGRMSLNDANSLLYMYGLENYGNTEVSYKNNTIYVKKGKQYYTLNLDSNASRDVILQWGSSIGVDLSSYV